MKINQFFRPRLLFWMAFIFVGLTVAAALFVFGLRENGTKVVNDISPDEQAGETLEPLRILFGGDIFLDRSIRRTIEANGIDYPWANIEDFLKSYKYKIANLEGPAWSRPQAAPTGSFNFAFEPEYVAKLKDLGFTALSLANNHTLNQGVRGLANSRTFLESLGVGYFGDPNNDPEFSYITYVYEDGELMLENDFSGPGRNVNSQQSKVDGFKLALVGEHDLVNQNQAAILTKISELAANGYFVAVLPHWGPEYVLTIPKIEQDRGRALVEAGADLIIGAHPHVVQPIEIYRGGVIFYSLGNFLFDQGFSYDTMHGLLVEVEFTESRTSPELKFNLYPTEQNKTFQTSLAPEEDRVKMLKRLSEGSIVPEEIRSDIAAGQFVIER